MCDLSKSAISLSHGFGRVHACLNLRSVSEMIFRTIHTCETTLHHAAGDIPPPKYTAASAFFIGIFDASNVYNFL